MSRDAPRVHADQAVIARMEDIARQLPQDARVEVHLDDGIVLRGMVSMRPSVQTFYDGNGREGLNAVARIESFLDDGRLHEGGDHLLWLDQVSRVTRLPNPSPPEASARTHPPAPKATVVDL